MEIQKLKYFISLAEILNFTKAADKNHITQATMSRIISSLEQELNATLLNRDSRNVSLTPEGEEFYLHARNIVNNYNHSVKKINELKSKVKSLKIGIGPYEHVLAQPLIEEFTHFYPEVQLDCLQYDYTNLSKRFREGEFDIMFCIDSCAFKFPLAMHLELHDGPWLTICSKNSPLTKLDSLEISSFDNYSFINMEAEAEAAQDNTESKPTSLGFKPVRSVKTNTLISKFILTASNVGISLVPNFMRNDIPDNIAILDYEYPSVRRFLCVYEDYKKDDEIVDSFLKFIKNKS